VKIKSIQSLRSNGFLFLEKAATKNRYLRIENKLMKSINAMIILSIVLCWRAFTPQARTTQGNSPSIFKERSIPGWQGILDR
jgi:hypothetical protein